MTRAPRLTPRQLEVARLVARGYSRREMAGALRVSLCTVRRHVQDIARRLDAPPRGVRRRICEYLDAAHVAA